MPLPIYSPLPWIGGKFHLAPRILAAFPPPKSYDRYVEPFGGAAHTLIQKPPYHHVEVYNDIHGDLVNFWLCMRDHNQVMKERLETLPYARALYYAYHKSLQDGTALEPVERAVRWFYVMRSSFTGWDRGSSAPGWKGGVKDKGRSDAHAFRSALAFFSLIQQRLQHVLIDNRDFAQVIMQHQSPQTLLYVDPPYIEAEGYYRDAFTLDDHKRLAALLNATPSYVALSYYQHPLLAELYPEERWQKVLLSSRKHSQRTKDRREQSQELLLMNYRQQTPLWATPLETPDTPSYAALVTA